MFWASLALIMWIKCEWRGHIKMTLCLRYEEFFLFLKGNPKNTCRNMHNCAQILRAQRNFEFCHKIMLNYYFHHRTLYNQSTECIWSDPECFFHQVLFQNGNKSNISLSQSHGNLFPKTISVISTNNFWVILPKF